MTRYDGLMEEIGEMLADYYVGEDASGLHFLIPFHEDRKLAERAIAATLKAVVDGKLELPDETGQFFKRRGWEKGLHNWVADMTAAGATRFIALRPIGTGEEE